MECSLGPVQPDRPPNIFDGDRVFANLVGDDPQQMQGIGMTRLDGQNLPVDLLSSLQTSGLMMLDGTRQCFGNRGHAVYYRGLKRIHFAPASACMTPNILPSVSLPYASQPTPGIAIFGKAMVPPSEVIF